MQTTPLPLLLALTIATAGAPAQDGAATLEASVGS